MKKIDLILLGLCLISACTKVEKTYTVEELKADETLLNKVLKECSEMSINEQNNSTNCQIANNAERDLTFKKIEENSYKFREWLKNETKSGK